MENHTYLWQPYDEGKTIGKTGSEGGIIMRDEEHPDGARITLERDCLRVPYAITCGVYGFPMHTRYIADEPTAIHEYEQMQPALAKILALVPDEDAPDYAEKYDAVTEALEQFAAQFQ